MEPFLHLYPIFCVLSNLNFLTQRTPKFKVPKILPGTLSPTQIEPKEPKRLKIDHHQTGVHILFINPAYRCFDMGCFDLGHFFKRAQFAQPSSSHLKSVVRADGTQRGKEYDFGGGEMLYFLQGQGEAHVPLDPRDATAPQFGMARDFAWQKAHQRSRFVTVPVYVAAGARPRISGSQCAHCAQHSCLVTTCSICSRRSTTRRSLLSLSHGSTCHTKHPRLEHCGTHTTFF